MDREIVGGIMLIFCLLLIGGIVIFGLFNLIDTLEQLSITYLLK